MKSWKSLLAPLSVFVVMAALLTTPVYAQDPPPDAMPVAMMDAAPEPVAAPVVEEKAEPAEKENGAALENAGNTPAPAMAAPEAPTALSKLSTELMNILVPTLVALIGALATFLLNWVRRKFKLNVSDHQISAWASIAEKAANRGGEWARNKAKEMTEGKKVPGPDVLEVAVDWAVEMGNHFGLPEMGREKLIGLIESHLHSNRVDAAHPLPLEIEEPSEG